MANEKYPKVEIDSPFNQASVSLLLKSQAPIDGHEAINQATIIAGQAARTCYSPNLQTPLHYQEKSDRYRQVTDKVIDSTLEAGHLTTRQHTHYTFGLEGVSRQLVNFLHSQPHYNSEEVSQRYVNFSDTKPVFEATFDPTIDKAQEEMSQSLIAGYQQLSAALLPIATEEIIARFPQRKGSKWQEFIAKEAQKKSQEVARYVLPLGTPTNLYFTISELTLLRLHALATTFPPQSESKRVIDAMTSAVSSTDPSFSKELESVEVFPPDNSPIFNQYKQEFDDLIAGNHVKLDSPLTLFSNHLVRAVRLITGRGANSLSDQECLALILDPNQNPHLASTLGTLTIDHLSQALNQVHLSALVSLSHTANYQLHRHRGLNHTTPLLLPIPESMGDIVIPTLISMSPSALQIYTDIHHQNSEHLNYLKKLGLSDSNLQYHLTNATRVRKSISGPLGAFYHFIKSRTCYTAQEEINAIAIGLANQLVATDPNLAPFFSNPAPCGVRHQAGITPFCPEGDRFCGIRIWQYNIDQYPPRTI